jgi:predicted hotdog family 3-hydroxylacyl-ACP dehydratase
VKPVRDLVPHQGAMCLLDEVLEWDAGRIVCAAASHRDPSNPLRGADGLSAIAGVEYAAQAVAAHAVLTMTSSAQRKGYLASLRDVICSVERLDTEPGDLAVSANQVAAEAGRLLYDFRIDAGGRELLRGRLSVVLRT